MSLAVDSNNYFYRGGEDVNQDGIYPDAALPSTSGGFTACGLGIQTAIAGGGGGTAFEPLLAMSGRFNSGGYFFTGFRNSTEVYADSGGGLADVPSEPSLGTWFQWFVTADPTGNQLLFAWKYYADSAWTMSVLNAHYGTQAFLQRMFLGTDEWGTGVGGKMAMANVRLWYKLKTPASLLTEVNSNVAVDTTGLWAWWKLRSDAPTNDSSGNGRVLTAVGAPSATGLPTNTLEAPSDVTGTAYTQTLTATLSSAGAIVKLPKKSFVGALTSSGAPRRTSAKALVGALTSSGIAREKPMFTLRGTVTPSGTAAKKQIKSLVGVVAPSGTAAKKITHTRTGGLTSSGTLTNRNIIARLFTGTMASSGTVVRGVATHLAGALAATGLVRFGVQWTLKGALTPSGLLGLGYRRTLTGSLTPSGASTTRGIVSIILTGAVGFAGTVQRGVATRLAGALMPTGIARKQGALTLTGSVQPTGTFRRGFPLLLTGAVGFAGSVQRTMGKTFRSFLTFVGEIAEHLPVGIQAILRGRDDSQAESRGRDESQPKMRGKNLDE